MACLTATIYMCHKGNRRGCPEIIDKFPRSRNNTLEESVKIYTHHEEMLDILM